MLTGLSASARDARSWPFEQARALLNRVLTVRLPDAAERGAAASLIGEGRVAEALAAHRRSPRPSWSSGVWRVGAAAHRDVQRDRPPHLGPHRLRALTEDAWPTRLIVVSDDMDGLRKVPDNVPNREAVALDLHKPLTDVRDPFGEHDSFGAYNNARMRAFLDGFGFEYEFQSSTEAYRSGGYDAVLLKALREYDAIQAVMLPTLGPERRATYSPFLPISPTTGRVLLVPTLERHPERGTIVFEDEDGTRVERPVTGGHVKMQWKPDWAMRWAALGVDYEMSGKDHIDNFKTSSRICRALGGVPPQDFIYELFLDGAGQKISKSKGNGLTLEEWLRYGPQESLSFYIHANPKSAKKLHFDVIPRAVDDYLTALDNYPAQEPVKALDNPVWAIHGGRPPQHGSPIAFTLLLNLASVANLTDKARLVGLRRPLPPGRYTGRAAPARPADRLRPGHVRGLRAAGQAVPGPGRARA
jgi:lysyl-tRNA synthetase class 1